jgi:hypothetical protein
MAAPSPVGQRHASTSTYRSGTEHWRYQSRRCEQNSWRCKQRPMSRRQATKSGAEAADHPCGHCRQHPPAAQPNLATEPCASIDRSEPLWLPSIHEPKYGGGPQSSPASAFASATTTGPSSVWSTQNLGWVIGANCRSGYAGTVNPRNTPGCFPSPFRHECRTRPPRYATPDVKCSASISSKVVR